MSKTRMPAKKTQTKTTKVVTARNPPRAALRVGAKPAAKPAPAPKPSPRLRISVPPPGQTVDDYVSKVVPWQRAVIQKLRAVVKNAAPNALESIKWGQPVYEHKGPFSYIKAHATHINFGFWRGAELEDPKRMLQGEGERMRHVKILETHAVDEVVLGALVKQAVALNDKKGDPTRGL
jgi:hypothetical protein